MNDGMKKNVKEKKKDDTNEQAVRYAGIVIVVILLMVLFAEWAFSPGLGIGSMTWIVTLLAVLVLLVCLRWVIVEESTAVAIKRFGEFNRMLFVKKDWILNDQHEAVDAKGHQGRILGGLFFYFWPFETIHSYDWHWIKSFPDGTIELWQEDDVTFILTKQKYGYALEITGRGAVTKDKIPIECKVILPAEITNPYKALFDETNWFNTFIGRIEAVVREYISNHTYEDLIVDPAAPPGTPPRYIDDEIWDELKDRGILDEFKDVHGVKLFTLEFIELKVEESYQKIMTLATQGKYEAEYRQNSAIGPFLERLAAELGITTVEELKAEIRKGPPAVFQKTYADAIKRAHQLLEQQIAGDKGSLTTVNFLDAQDPVLKWASMLGLGGSLFPKPIAGPAAAPTAAKTKI